MGILKFNLVQTKLYWENQQANFKHITALLSTAQHADITVLPEMFNTGFSMQPHLFADPNGQFVTNQMKEWAIKHKSVICGSAMIAETNKYYNRFYWVKPNNQEILTYNKAHLFRMGLEHMHYTKGNYRTLIKYKDFVLAPFICYDLRFPVWLKRTADFNYDAMIIVANWPQKRSNHWKILLQARAIENQCYVIAVNRVGLDGNNINHTGDSMVISAQGEILWHGYNTEEVKNIAIDLDEVMVYRNSFPVEADDDKFNMV